MLYACKQWIHDLDLVLASLPELPKLEGRKVLITGASGLICSSIVDIMFRYNDTHSEKIQILAAGRKRDKMLMRFGSMVHREDFHFLQYDASQPSIDFSESPDFIIHGASNSYPSLFNKAPVETMVGNFIGMKGLLDFASRHGTRRVLFISSSEIYGTKENDKPFQENEYGFIDVLNPRSAYPMSKRATETLCASYSNEYGLETVIVRPGHIYGPTASPDDNRVSSAWAYQAARGEDIVMKSSGHQPRSYCYCLDCASAILKVLISGQNTNAYNVSNPESVITIRKLGEILAKSGNVRLLMDIPTDNEKKSFNPMANSSLDSRSLQMIGWKAFFNAEQGLSHTVEILKELQTC